MRWMVQGRPLIDESDGHRGRPLVMGILNVTPDSFADGGRHLDPSAALDHALRLLEEGADLIDLGGESSRPGAEPVPLEVEWNRVAPVLERLIEHRHPRDHRSVVVSIDTTKPEVARRALESGVAIVNDIGGFRDPAMLDLLARAPGEPGAIAMHMRGQPRTMQHDPVYTEVVAEVGDFLAQRLDALEAAGIARERVSLDPGVGFGKTLDHNLALLRRLPELTARLERPLLIGTSRKSMLGRLTGRDVNDRLPASIASALAAAFGGARILRVHDVAATVDALTVWEAQVGWNSLPTSSSPPYSIH
ncbi:Dihydropteroate synthase [Isosphaera pallida ATCC 43644]|uniref:Dihydropteroate synthase n=1 Tax=Isosphaera pallida (strain ATCC 43644 / DSM 9630 / IS1B) TaxID=575540 RepID=E8QXT1_ISOPI|nr:dihydropteroate synthase [Isosphaera pallida]ADV64118.1 Dihydropteroate synthase [Isosphaera pallida ATCC 43644]